MNNIINQFRKKFGSIRSIKEHDENIPFFAKDITKDIESFILDALKRQREEICDRLEKGKEIIGRNKSSITWNVSIDKAIEVIKSKESSESTPTCDGSMIQCGKCKEKYCNGCFKTCPNGCTTPNL